MCINRATRLVKSQQKGNCVASFALNIVVIKRFQPTAGKEYVCVLKLHGDADERQVQKAIDTLRFNCHNRSFITGVDCLPFSF